MAKQFLQVDDNRIINVRYIHSVTLNKDGKWGWVKVIDEDRYSKYKITPDMFESIRKLLLNLEDTKEQTDGS